MFEGLKEKFIRYGITLLSGVLTAYGVEAVAIEQFVTGLFSIAFSLLAFAMTIRWSFIRDAVFKNRINYLK